MKDPLNSCTSAEPFALQVLGNSMEPEFPDKCIVMIEPTDAADSGMYIMVMVEGVRWFRQYLNDNEGERLAALNDLYPEIPLVNLEWTVEGVIVQRHLKIRKTAGKRREIKHYEYQ